LPQAYGLAQNYPNPFNPVTVISYSLPAYAQVKLEVFNILGQRVRSLVDCYQPPGDYRVVWDSRSQNGREVASGVYFYRLSAGDFSKSRKMLLLK
jgi:hypothetical protein